MESVPPLARTQILREQTNAHRINTYYELESVLSELLHQSLGNEEHFQRNVREYLKDLYDHLSDEMRTEAGLYAIGIAAHFFLAIGSALPADSSGARLTTAISNMGDRTGQMFVQLRKRDETRIQGFLEEMRDLLSRGNTKRDEGMRLLNDIRDVLRSAHEARSRQISMMSSG
ncbi:MAG: hypothetical protein A3F09_02710 [Chlamydiae bacterium RIFCSPHIGHO2_12_FULL_49_11]|nr:MAG: hypothetical protein A3F09_02710 [Chlamydiae bacterium RIFCSPHIGHO2_12_FULL_49_11]